MLLIILKATASFLLAYWLAAVVLMAVGFFIFKKTSPSRWQHFIWIFISAAILSLVFNSTHYFNATAAMFAVIIQTFKVTNKDNKIYSVFLAYFLGWFLIFIALLYLKK